MSTIERIKKLLTLAENPGAAENEAETARRLAEGMMAAAGITREEVFEQSGIEDVVKSVGVSVSDFSEWGWQKVAQVAVGRFTGCFTYRDPNRKVTVWIGTAAQREAATALFPWIIRQIDDASRSMKRRNRNLTQAFLNAYRVGMADAIAEQAVRLTADYQAKIQSDQNALLVVDRIAEAVDFWKPDTLKKGRGAMVKHGGGYASGKLDGQNIKFRREMTGSGPKRLGSG